MAVGAIFGHRLVLPQEGSALFGMAGEAGFSHRVLLKKLGAGRAVGIVTVGTDHLALTDGVMRYLSAVHALLLVAGKADFRLRLLVAHPVVIGMNLVTGTAGKIVAGVLGAFPMRPVATLVACQTGLGLFIGRRWGILSEHAIGLGLTRLVAPLEVCLAFAMAAGAGWGASIGRDTVLGQTDFQDFGAELVFAVVAGRTLGVASQNRVAGPKLGGVVDCPLISGGEGSKT